MAEHRKHVKDTLQAECDASAKTEAMSRLWDTVRKNATLIKEPTRNIKKYVKDYMDYFKSMYYDQGYKDQKTSSGALVYKSFESFVFASFSANFGEKYETMEAVENSLYAKGKEESKDRLLAYYLADALGIRYTEDELENLAKEKGTAWAKKQMADMKDAFTPDANATEEEKKNLSATLLYYYGFNSVEEIPDDFFTWETYVETYGEEYLYYVYHADAVMEKLYELNYKADGTGTLTYKDIAYKAAK